jgi:hypothetical protein
LLEQLRAVQFTLREKLRAMENWSQRWVGIKRHDSHSPVAQASAFVLASQRH